MQCREIGSHTISIVYRKMLTSEALNQNKNESQDNEATDVKDLTGAAAERSWISQGTLSSQSK